MFEQGNQFGNRKGRPKLGLAVAEKVRQLGGDDGATYLEQLHHIATAEHKDVRARLMAIGMLLDRGWGKPLQELDVLYRDDASNLVNVSDAELRRRAQALLQQLTDQADAESESDAPPTPTAAH